MSFYFHLLCLLAETHFVKTGSFTGVLQYTWFGTPWLRFSLQISTSVKNLKAEVPQTGACAESAVARDQADWCSEGTAWSSVNFLTTSWPRHRLVGSPQGTGDPVRKFTGDLYQRSFPVSFQLPREVSMAKNTPQLCSVLIFLPGDTKVQYSTDPGVHAWLANTLDCKPSGQSLTPRSQDVTESRTIFQLVNSCGDSALISPLCVQSMLRMFHTWKTP